MQRLVIVLLLVPFWIASSPATAQNAPKDETEASIRRELAAHAMPLHDSGEEILLKEAGEHPYFLLGELHGENEIPNLLGDLWPMLWRAGYRHIAAEVSPWAATHLAKPEAEDATPVPGLWTRTQAANVARFASTGYEVLWGCDIEELQPDRLIRQMAQLNPANAHLRAMAEMVAGGYNRKQAPALLQLAESEHPAQDTFAGRVSLWQNTLDTLRVEALRSDSRMRYAASDTRERVMKNLFLAHRKQEPEGKVLLRFGRNHLHRGMDARGISTLGNFVAEWAFSQGQSVVNVGVFAAGGKEHLAGQTFDADERQDEPAFALLATLAGSSATLFNLRELRSVLRTIPTDKRTALEANLAYWADSYDFLLCYPSVTPLADLSADPHL